METLRDPSDNISTFITGDCIPDVTCRPNRSKYSVIIAVLAAGGFGYGFFYLLNENSKLEDVEWLYRYERLWWEGKEQEDMLRREKTFAVGTPQEQDSIKNRTRQLEKSRHIEETFLYFNPTEK